MFIPHRSRIWYFKHRQSLAPVRYSSVFKYAYFTLQWRHNGCDNVSNHQPHDCLLNRLCRSKKTSTLRITGLCAGNSPVPGEFPAQMASYAESISIWWRHHDKLCGDRVCVACFYELALSCIQPDVIDQSTLAHVIYWCHLETLRYPNNINVTGTKWFKRKHTSITV